MFRRRKKTVQVWNNMIPTEFSILGGLKKD